LPERLQLDVGGFKPVMYICMYLARIFVAQARGCPPIGWKETVLRNHVVLELTADKSALGPSPQQWIDT
jgi:hypothetical protein